MNFPNKLTFSRIILGPLFMLSFFGGKIYLSVALILANLIGDFFDGYIARKNKNVTKLGEILDPSIDLLFFLFVYLSFSLNGYNKINWFIIPVLLIFLSFIPNIKKSLFEKKPLKDGSFEFSKTNEIKVFHTKTKYFHTPLLYAFAIISTLGHNFEIIFLATIALFTITCLETFLRSIKHSLESIKIGKKPKL